jgi:hypothetical protein
VGRDGLKTAPAAMQMATPPAAIIDNYLFLMDMYSRKNFAEGIALY